jgi:hypothetical protein
LSQLHLKPNSLPVSNTEHQEEKEMPIFETTDNTTSPLGRYRILAPRCGLRVSPLQLGAMSIGEAWSESGFGSMDKERSFKLLDRFYELWVFVFVEWSLVGHWSFDLQRR